MGALGHETRCLSNGRGLLLLLTKQLYVAKGPKEKGRGKWGGKRGYNMRTKALKPQRANESRPCVCLTAL